MDIQLLEKHHIEMCCRLFVDVFSREPWNEQYESDEEVNRYFVNFLSLDSSLGFVGLEEGRLIALWWSITLTNFVSPTTVNIKEQAASSLLR